MSENKKNEPRIDPETQVKLTGHHYDGIEELDNPLPGWWLMTFYLAILFSGIYFIHYHLADGSSLADTYRRDIEQLEFARSAEALLTKSSAAPDFKTLLADAGAIAKGKAVFGNTCVSCHGSKAEGGIGPNLIDRFWLHGKGTPQDILGIVRDGVSAKGMPPWGAVLKPDDLAYVAAYVRSIKGTSAPGAKAPQGTEIED